MPIFEYDCLECGGQFEHLQRTADAQVTCPFCGRSNLRRLISLCGVSSEARSAANLSAAHRRAAAKRDEKQRSEHAHHHEHFGDAARPTE
jgi:putative FmdB family regulatory protein